MQDITGFNVLELLIVMAIIMILATLAYPGYRWQLNRHYRQAVQMDLLVIATDLEHYYSTHHTYQGATLRWHSHHHYQFQIDSLTTNSYHIRARGQQTHDELSLDNAGLTDLSKRDTR